MPKVFLYLIIVWTLICVSGLGVFLFEMYGPGSDVNSPNQLESPVFTAGFWVFLWIVPVIVLIVLSRRQKNGQD